GIMREDVKTAFLPHATSKITVSEDLFRIETLGFRGEALASVAAVAKVTLSTMTKDAEIGTKLVISGGEIKECTDTATVQGTTIEVEDLFFNVPARLKFLKSPRSEASYISDLVSRLILANPSVAVKLIQNGKTVYQSAGDSNIDNAIYAVYGSSVLEHLRKVDYDDGYIKIAGRAGTEQIAKSNRSWQSLFVNSRYIKSAKLSYALSRAYDTKMMVGMFPFCVLYITMSSADMDVNVHPGKLEIRFKDEERVVRSLTTAVRNALLQPVIREMQLSQKQIYKTETKQQTVQSDFKPNVSRSPERLPEHNKIPLAEAAQQLDELRKQNDAVKLAEKREVVVSEPGEYEFYKKPFQDIEPQKETELPFAEKTVIVSKARRAAESLINDDKTEITKTEQTLFADESYRIVGQLFDCYIIIEQGNSVFFIDQHAAHERKLYEELMQKEIKVVSQQLLIPLNVKLTPIEYDIYTANMDEFATLGFEIEDFGMLNISIRAVPHMLGETQTVKFLHEALNILADNRKLSTHELKRASLIQSACKHAIKQGDNLAAEIIEELLRQVKEKEVPLTCPHGRPVILKMTRLEFEKQFKRVL
ncbi:MAG: DNA mismatch repair endonuclease MutL, partial [Clostridia bacterium]|nr:DNA mismatch repair endonuclease MutL [Clostridia bacterium]